MIFAASGPKIFQRWLTLRAGWGIRGLLGEAEELKMAFVLVEAVVDDLGTAVPHDVVALAALGEVHLEAGVAVVGLDHPTTEGGDR